MEDGSLYMDRKVGAEIAAWMRSNDTHPLLVRGARRTGKTSVIEHEGRRIFGNNYIKLDFQTDLSNIEMIFDGPTNNLDRITDRIAEYKGITKLEPNDALLFFDEVQLSEKALNSLRFFSGSPWRVIASGSLLGVTTKKRKLPFPSGVRQLELHPLDFEEFLWACDQKAMADSIREHARNCDTYILHRQALDLYHRYLVVGGMPLPLRRWLETGLLQAAMEELEEIDATYTADMTDPDNGISGISAKRIWNSIPQQLLRSSTKKFKYADVVRGGRRARLLEPLEWLEAAGVITRNDLTKDTVAPLAPYNDDEGSFFKIYLCDVGLMFKKFGIQPSVFLDPTTSAQLSSDFRGALAENYVMESFCARDIKTYYWMPSDNNAQGEVDFIYQNNNMEVIPVEVKSGRNVRAKSLRKLMDEGGSPYCVRLSELDFARTFDEFGHEIRSLPLYAAFAI